LTGSSSARDDMIRAGGKPKDHMREYRNSLKLKQKENQQKKEVLGVFDRQLLAEPEPKPFKLKAFERVESRLKLVREMAHLVVGKFNPAKEPDAKKELYIY
jgi:hypothetical protein